MRKQNMKSLVDIQEDMSVLYNAVRSGESDLKVAAELANIAGKYLKAEQLKLAREIFTSAQGRLGRNAGNAAALTLTQQE